MLSHANLHFTGSSAHASAYVAGVNRALTTLPLSHAYGMLVTVSAFHASDPGVSVLLRWFDPTAFLELIAEH
jgi:long-chain acyl-CoA synthetase